MPGQNILTESFLNADVTQLNWLYGKSGSLDPVLTARSSASPSATGGLPGSPTGATDASGSGALRLTTNTTNQGTFVIYNQPINAASGLNVEFDLYSYGGNGADGISFFLIDGAANPERAGAVGGSLGYSYSTVGNSPGLVGGYLGVGFDEFGNFSVPGYGQGGGPFSPDTIAIRGKAPDYAFLNSIKLPTGTSIDVTNTTVRENARRRVAIELDNTGNLSVSFDVNANGTLEAGEKLLNNFNVTNLNGPLPSTFKFGFAASTGSSTNFHEINNLVINTFDGPYIPLVDFNGGTQVIRTNGSVNITATIDVETTQPVTIPLTLGGDAVLGTDYQLSSNLITIAAGQKTGSVTLTGLLDTQTTTSKNVQINLGAPTNAILSPQNAALNLTLANIPLVNFNGGTRVIKPNGSFEITATLDIAATQTVTIPITLGGDAISGTDYQLSSSLITIAAGQTTGRITINGLSNSPSAIDKTIQINIGQPSNAALNPQNSSLLVQLTRMSDDDCSLPDFNGDGSVDLFWRNPVTTQAAVWLLNGTQVTAADFLAITGANWGITATRDYDADGKTDLLWRNTVTGENAIWLMNGTQIASAGFITTIADQNWQVATSRDFNNDGSADIFWLNAATGETQVWLIDKLAVTNTAASATVAAGWQVADTADFNNDGKADVVWRNTVTGENAIWLMNGTAIANAGFLTQVQNQDWKLIAARDTSGDGKADLIWRNNITGENAIWLIDGVMATSQQFILKTTNPNWQIADVCDTSGDGKADLVWRNSVTGENAVWLLDGTSLADAGFITSVSDQNWEIVAVRDTSRDGKADLIWRNNAIGEDAIWLMDGKTPTNQAFLPRTEIDWRVQTRLNALAL